MENRNRQREATDGRREKYPRKTKSDRGRIKDLYLLRGREKQPEYR